MAMSFRREILLAAAVVSVMAGGCKPAGDPLPRRRHALEQEDYDQAVILANQSLEEVSTGPKAAEALYMRGRAYEQRLAKNNAQLAANMQAARTSYVAALQHNPSTLLTTYILRAAWGRSPFSRTTLRRPRSNSRWPIASCATAN